MRLHRLFPIWTVIVPLTLAQNLTFTLLHRFHPSLPIEHLRSTEPQPDGGSWYPRGTVTVDFAAAAATFEERSLGMPVVHGEPGGWYQVMLKGEGEEEWPMASTRACFLAHPSNAKLTLHLTPSFSSSLAPPASDSAHLTSITFTPLNVPPSGECPEEWKRKTLEFPHTRSGGRIWVEVRRPERVSGPALAPPPTVDASTGLPAPPPVEKSFLQKYWLPIVGLAVFALSQMGPDEPRRGAGGGGAGS